MAAFRFLHTADLHLGRRFGNLPEEVRGRLIEARHQILPRLAAAAKAHGAKHILIAGDTFDTETPSDPVWRQALTAMAAAEVTWWLIPGNHDSLAAETLWARLEEKAPANVRLIRDAGLIEMEAGVALLPAPLPSRYSGRDLTTGMATLTTPPDTYRIGLAHGAVRDFSEDGRASDGIIPPDRAETARLDYLALGDWHGQMRLGARTAYAGTPERDSFRHDGLGACLAVTLHAPGAVPEITSVPLGRFCWNDIELALVPGLSPQDALAMRLPADIAQRRDHLVRLRATGRASLADQAALRDVVAHLAPDFAYFSLDTTALGLDFDVTDLDMIDRAGALRMAADQLAADAADQARAPEDRRIAAGALNRLYGYLTEAAQ